jgi:uncharacterized protein (TIGR00369 family)
VNPTSGRALPGNGAVHAPHVDSPLSGLDGMRALQAGAVGRPGVARLLGMTIEAVDEGRVVFGLEARPDFANPLGTVHGGILSTLLDSAMGCAVYTTLPSRWSYTTVDLTVAFVRAAALDGGRLRAEGSVIHRGGRVATAEGRLTDADGRLLAHAVTTCMVLRPEPDGGGR